MHVERANLDLEERAPWPEDCRVQRLVAVGLGLRDVVLDPLLHRCPTVVDHAERVIALGHRFHEHPHREQVVDLVVRLLALRHLLVDRRQVLGSPRNVVQRDARLVELLLQRPYQLRDQRLALRAPLLHELGERLVLLGLDMLEREIFELPAHLRHAEAVCERCVQVARFLRNLASPLGRHPLERAHVVQPVGEHDQDDARVLRNRQQQLAVVLDLPFLHGGERQAADLGHPIDDGRHLLAERRLDVGHRDVGVLDHIVHPSARDPHSIALELREDLRDLDAVRDMRIARMANLARVRPLGKLVRARQELVVESLAHAVGQLPSRNDIAQRGDGHSSPASRTLVFRPRPMITWSSTGMPSTSSAPAICQVTRRSSGDGAGSPDGWLCTSTTPAAQPRPRERLRAGGPATC